LLPGLKKKTFVSNQVGKNMVFSERTLLVLAVILFFGLIIPQFFRRFQFPFSTSLIIVGSIMGPYGLNYVTPDETMKIFGFLGATFLMLLAGFEAQTLPIRRLGKAIYRLSAWSAVLPFSAGVGIALLFDYSWQTALFIGTLFISSSILLVFSEVSYLQLKETRLGNTMESLATIQDLGSALLLFVLFKYFEPHSRFPLPILLGLLLSSVIILRMFLPEVVLFFFERFERTRDEYESKLRLVIALLFFVILIYAALDVEPIIAAFLVGFSLSEIPESASVKEKIRSFGYGFFIPIYLFIVGVEIDLGILLSLDFRNVLLMSLVAAALISKLLGGLLGARGAGFSRKEALLIGVVSTQKLTVVLSAAYVGLQLAIIDNALFTGVVIVVVLGALAGPLLSAFIRKRME
jgi:Kef-type K+ transport system membrane component KefB